MKIIDSIMNKVASIPGSVYRSEEVPAVGGGITEKITEVYYGGMRVAIDPHDEVLALRGLGDHCRDDGS